MPQYNNLSATEFEVFVAAIFTRMGYKTCLRGKTNTPDDGVDIEARRRGQYTVIQCKRYSPSNTVAQVDVRAFYGSVEKEKATKGYIVTTGRYSARSKAWAENLPLELIDAQGIDQWLKKYPIHAKKIKQRKGGSMFRLRLIRLVARLRLLFTRKVGVKTIVTHVQTTKHNEPRTHKANYRVQISQANPDLSVDVHISDDYVKRLTTVTFNFRNHPTSMWQVRRAMSFYRLARLEVQKRAKFKIVD